MENKYGLTPEDAAMVARINAAIDADKATIRELQEKVTALRTWSRKNVECDCEEGICDRCRILGTVFP